MNALTGIRLGILLLLMPACVPDTPDLLQSIDSEGLHFTSGQTWALAEDTGQLILFLLAYAPTDPPPRLAAFGERVGVLFRDAGIAGIYILDRPSALDVIQPLGLATSAPIHPFAYEDARDTLDHILTLDNPAPRLMITSLSVREELLSSRFPVDRQDWTDQGTDDLAVLVLRPRIGLQIMKFPF
ncbi:MAG: hypothetical protein R2787_09675 [Saprospiraceae bacterium]